MVHCLGCKKKTDTKNAYLIKTKNNRFRLSGSCAECGRNKSQFVGSGFISDILKNFKLMGKKAFLELSNFLRDTKNPRVRKLLLGEFHFGNHAFTGPGTRIDLPEIRNFKPYNDVDNCSRNHDIELETALKEPNINKRNKMIRIADKKSVRCFSSFPNQNGSLAGQLGINAKMGVENISPKLAKFLLGDIAKS